MVATADALTDSTSQPSTRLRILCLHGFRQTSGQLKGRLNALQKRLKHEAELVYCDGPFLLPQWYKPPQQGTWPAHSTPPTPTKFRSCWLVSPELQQLQPQLLQQAQAATGLPSRAAQGMASNTVLQHGPECRPLGSPAEGPALESVTQAGGSSEQPTVSWSQAPEWVNEQQLDQQVCGWQYAWAAVQSAVQHLGPFDGILGFSQGAAVAAGVVAAYQHQQQAAQLGSHDGKLEHEQSSTQPHTSAAAGATSSSGHHAEQQQQQVQQGFKFAILCSGYIPGCPPELMQLLHQQGSLQLPSLHMYSTSGADKQVPAEASRQLLRCCAAGNRQVVEHGCGHIIPTSPDVVGKLKEFLQPFLQRGVSSKHA